MHITFHYKLDITFIVYDHNYFSIRFVVIIYEYYSYGDKLSCFVNVWVFCSIVLNELAWYFDSFLVGNS